MGLKAAAGRLLSFLKGQTMGTVRLSDEYLGDDEDLSDVESNDFLDEDEIDSEFDDLDIPVFDMTSCGRRMMDEGPSLSNEQKHFIIERRSNLWD